MMTPAGTQPASAVFDNTGNQHDLPTWEEVVRDHGDKAYRLAFRLTGNQQDAEDITQDAFIRVFNNLADYKPGTFDGWMHRIVTNLFLDMVRRKAKIRFDSITDTEEQLHSPASTPENIYLSQRFNPQVQQALMVLAPDYRAAIVLCDIEGLTYEEVGKALGVKVGTVRSRIHRGRTALRKELLARGVTSTAVTC